MKPKKLISIALILFIFTFVLVPSASAAGLSDCDDCMAWPEAFAKRMKEHNLARLKAIGIDPENEKQIRDNYSRNYKFYDAPCVIFVGMDKSLTSWSVFDLGCFAQSILLGLEAEGLGGVIQASVTNYGDIIRKEVGAPETMAFLISISVGHPDLEAPVNSYRSRRKESGEFVRWVGL